MSELQGIPFVPGVARGILRRGHAVSPDNILVLTQQELGLSEPRPAGIIVVEGAPLSHPMIRLFGLGIPTVMVTAETATDLEEGREVLIDGTRGRIIWPAKSVSGTAPSAAPRQPGKPLTTADGVPIALRASVSSAKAAATAAAQGAVAIGLVRSEYLAPDDGRLPDSAFFKIALGELCDAAHPLPVTIRLPDIAADKQVPWLKPVAGMTGPLGLQGVRLYDREPVRSVLNSMLEAVTTLADRHVLSLLLPYVVRQEEFLHWRSEVEQRLGTALPIGVMTEAPAAILDMQHWFEVADFVSIGCNDLMQCLFAADRDIPELRSYLDAYAPSLFQFLRQAAGAAGENIDRVQLCGLLPQLPGVLPVLLGMGYRAFSVESLMIPSLAQTANGTTLSEATVLARQVCAAADSQQVRELLALPLAWNKP
jgi:phosphoenolpyruvate-protein kinase (PTS system EI component)